MKNQGANVAYSFSYLQHNLSRVKLPRNRSFNNYLHAVLNSTREAIFLLHTSGEIKIYNESARDMILQYTGSDISTTSNLVDAVPEWRKPSVRQGIAKAALGEANGYEVYYPHGEWLDVYFFPVYNQAGAIIEICCTLKNITSRKNDEEKIKRNEERYRSLIETMMEGVIFQSADRNKNISNDSAAAILGVSKETLAKDGLLNKEFIWVDQKGRIINLEETFCPRMKQHQSVRNLTLGLQKASEPGKITWLVLNAEPVRKDQYADMQGCVFTFSDITESIKNRQELDLLSKVIRETSNIVVITDRDEKIIWANDSFSRISEYRLEEALNKKPGQLLGGPEKDMYEVKKIKDAITRGEPVKGEILNYTKSGKKYWSNYNIHPVKDDEGRLVKFFSIQSDITELKKIQEEVIRQRFLHQEQMANATIKAQEEKQTEIGQELHDNINQLLAVAKIHIGCINHSNHTKESIQKASECIQLAIDEIRQLSHQLVTPRFQEETLTGVLDALYLKNRKDIAIQKKISGLNENSLSPEIKLALYRIAQEQFNNIYKHAKARSIDLRITGDTNRVTMLISDDGVGFDPSQRKNGIGIQNIYRRAESLNGSADIVSAPGKGCQLSVIIPLSEDFISA